MGVQLKVLFPIRQPGKVRLGPGLAERLGLQGRHRGWVGFGLRRESVEIEVSDDVPEGELQLGRSEVDALGVPDYVPLDAEVEGAGILLGPLVGVLIEKEDSRITEQMLTARKSYRTERLGTVTYHTPIGIWGYVTRYAELRGAVVLFALDAMDHATQRVSGYCYDPGSERWRRGTCPFPRSIYRRVGLPEAHKSLLLSTVGDAVYNSYYADKWEVAQWLDEAPALRPHLPETVLYRDFADLERMLDRHPVVYTKPIGGMGGHGVMQVRRDGQDVLFSYRHQDTNHLERLAPEAARGFAHAQLSGGDQLVQQGIDLLGREGSVLDIRCLMQKERGESWICQGIIIRQGVAESVVSNISSGGWAWTVDELFVERLGWTSEAAQGLVERIHTLGRQICERLDGVGLRLCYVGVDLGLDQDLRLWVIEVNMRDPDATIALDVNDRDLYDRLKINPLIYGSFLGGFRAP